MSMTWPSCSRPPGPGARTGTPEPPGELDGALGMVEMAVGEQDRVGPAVLGPGQPGHRAEMALVEAAQGRRPRSGGRPGSRRTQVFVPSRVIGPGLGPARTGPRVEPGRRARAGSSYRLRAGGGAEDDLRGGPADQHGRAMHGTDPVPCRKASTLPALASSSRHTIVGGAGGMPSPPPSRRGHPGAHPVGLVRLAADIGDLLTGRQRSREDPRVEPAPLEQWRDPVGPDDQVVGRHPQSGPVEHLGQGTCAPAAARFALWGAGPTAGASVAPEPAAGRARSTRPPRRPRGRLPRAPPSPGVLSTPRRAAHTATTSSGRAAHVSVSAGSTAPPGKTIIWAAKTIVAARRIMKTSTPPGPRGAASRSPPGAPGRWEGPRPVRPSRARRGPDHRGPAGRRRGSHAR